LHLARQSHNDAAEEVLLVYLANVYVQLGLLSEAGQYQRAGLRFIRRLHGDYDERVSALLTVCNVIQKLSICCLSLLLLSIYLFIYLLIFTYVLLYSVSFYLALYSICQHVGFFVVAIRSECTASCLFVFLSQYIEH